MKKLLSLLLAVILCLSLLPSAAFAWTSDDIMDLFPDNVQEPKKQSWLDESRTMYVASKSGTVIMIHRGPKKSAESIGEASEAEQVTVYAIEKDFALAIINRTGEGGWLNCDKLVDEYYRSGPGPADTLNVSTAVTRPENDEYFDEFIYFTVKSKNGSSSIIYTGTMTGTEKLDSVKDGELVVGFARSGNSTLIMTESGIMGWVQTKYLKETDVTADQMFYTPATADDRDIDDTDDEDTDDENPPKKETPVAGEMAVEEWTDVVSLFSCDFALLGIRSDGRVYIDRDAICDDFCSYRDWGSFFEEADIKDAVEEITGWEDVSKLFNVCGVPVAITASGNVLVPELLDIVSADSPNSEDALSALRKAENVESISDSADIIYVVEKGGKIDVFPLDEGVWQEFLDGQDYVWMEEGEDLGPAVNPADVFSSNSYSNVIVYGHKAIGIDNSDGTIVTAGSLPEKIRDAVKDWKGIERIYIFSSMSDQWTSGEVEILIGVNGKGKIFCEMRDDAEFDESYGKLLMKEIGSWKKLKDFSSSACWDAGTAKIVAMMEDGSAKFINSYVFEEEELPKPKFASATKVLDVSMGDVSGFSVIVLLQKGGKLTVNAFDSFEGSADVTASCSGKLASLCENSCYYGIAEDGTVCYIEYTLPEFDDLW